MSYGDHPDEVHITCGSLDPELGARLKELFKESNEGKGEPGHIFTSEKALWDAA